MNLHSNFWLDYILIPTRPLTSMPSLFTFQSLVRLYTFEMIVGKLDTLNTFTFQFLVRLYTVGITIRMLCVFYLHSNFWLDYIHNNLLFLLMFLYYLHSNFWLDYIQFSDSNFTNLVTNLHSNFWLDYIPIRHICPKVKCFIYIPISG